ncbi:zinc-ribbon domain-containing protein [Peribacillus frigoritolerans]|uniref:zinc-ribbon domain-containing protein n=1 Tax=Peribacillus frigoritolerans TaxID=450367 RepID=UPI00342B6709
MATFLDVRPDLAKYYKPKLNDGKLMNEITKGSNEKITLCCNVCNHPKTTSIANYARVLNNFKCNYCNSLGALRPDLAKEWHPVKNGSVTSFDVRKSTHKKAWWLGICEHEWESSINDRDASNAGCPYCNGKKVLYELSLEYNFLIISKQWHPIKNGKKNHPRIFFGGSNKKMWWLGDCGQEWQAVIYHRTGNYSGCPTCSISKEERKIVEWLLENDIDYKIQHHVNINGAKRFFDI